MVPVQLFAPPLWLTFRDTVFLSGQNTYKLYEKTVLSNFLQVVQEREGNQFANDMLSREWDIGKKDGGPLIANALENHTDIDWFSYRYLSGGKDDEIDAKVQAFIEADPIRKVIVRMKEDDAAAFDAD